MQKRFRYLIFIMSFLLLQQNKGVAMGERPDYKVQIKGKIKEVDTSDGVSKEGTTMLQQSTAKSLFRDGDFEMQVNENYKKAISYYRAVLKKKPDSDNSYSRIAMCYFALGKYRDAEDSLKGAITLDSEQPYHYYLLGVVQRKEKKISTKRC